MIESKILVGLGTRSYSVSVGTDILGGIAADILRICDPTSITVITHPHLFRRFGHSILSGFAKSGICVNVLSVASGERSKCLRSVSRLYLQLAAHKVDRKGLVIALGGGVIGDLAGFVSASYLRGISFVQVPTTLLAQVDAAIGGKTGIDLSVGKNLVGAFHQPLAVYVDVSTLKSLSNRELCSGLSEVVKYGIIADKGLFDGLVGQLPAIRMRDPKVLMMIASLSCAIKADVVSKDETEQGLRAILNFGHTVGHALESITNYRRYKHGEAVSIGMVVATRLGIQMGITQNGVLEPIIELLQKIGLPTQFPDDIDRNQLIQAMLGDKKTVGGKLNFVIPIKIGSVQVVKDVSSSLILSELSRFSKTG